jgi:Fic family protein
MYLYNNENWPIFTWNSEKLMPLLSYVRNRQGKLIGKMGALGFELQNEANLEILTQEIIKSTEIEGEFLDRDQVRSSIARKLGLEIADLGKISGLIFLDSLINFTSLPAFINPSLNLISFESVLQS